MDMMEAMKQRHCVRSYRKLPLNHYVVDAVEKYISTLSGNGVSLKLVTNEPKAFGGIFSRIGTFKNAVNYIILSGDKNKEFEAGYCGEQAVLRITEWGLNSCWVSGTYSKSVVKKQVPESEKVFAVIVIGNGDTKGEPHKSKPIDVLCSCRGGVMPQWFELGIQAAMLAPTAMNRQKFHFTYDGKDAYAQALSGLNTMLDLGIAVCHFETASGREVKITRK